MRSAARPAVRMHVRLARSGSGREARKLAPYGSIPGDEPLRAAHLAAIEALDQEEGLDWEVLQDVDRLQLGRRRGGSTARAAAARRREHACAYSQVGVVLAHDDPLPALPLDLPEVAIVGRSNTGKSALLNALCGVKAQHGAASVSSRPGHTAALNFYELRQGPLSTDALMCVLRRS